MSTALILLPVLCIYIGLLYWIYRHFNVKGIWQGEGIALIQVIEKPIFTMVKGVLDFFFVFFIIIAIIIAPITLILSLSQGSSATWGVDISIFSGFRMNLDAISGIDVTGLRNPELSGKTFISIDTANITAFYLFMLSQAALTLAGLYGVSQIRSLVISLKNGNAFCTENAIRLKRVGLLVIVWNIISPLCQYVAWGAVINTIHFSNNGLQLFPAFEFDVMAIFIGAMMVILSDLFLEATVISQEQRLTI